MVAIFKETLTAEAIKSKARALGADLVGIADGAALERHPPDPKHPQRPSDITDHDGARVIVLVPDKVALGKAYKESRARGDDISGLNEWNSRWVGPEGYKGIVARQLQEFKKAQAARSESKAARSGSKAAPALATEGRD